MRTVLLLGGTHEARQVAEQYEQTETHLIASLAGVTSRPHRYSCEMRFGGFGGADGMRAWMVENRICAVIDATHPFATRISANASLACSKLSVPRMVLRRKAWEPSGKWCEFDSSADLAKSLPPGARVFLTTGHADLQTFASRGDVSFLLRSIEPPRSLPSNVESMLSRLPCGMDDEIAVLRDRAITHLVTKNAGGTLPAKVTAAKSLGIEILSVAMPAPPPGDVVLSVSDALDWVRQLPMP